MTYKNSTKYLAEGLGTFVLVLMGCGAATISGISATGPTGIGVLGIALAFGLSVVCMAYAIGPISGCHINPAITVAMLVAGKIDGKNAIGYIVSQIIGAIIASGLLALILSGQSGYTEMGSLGANGWGEGYLGEYDMVSALIVEVVLTFIFLMVIFGATSKDASPAMGGLAIGLSLALIHIVSIPITGTSVNPARSLGPAIVSGGQAMSQVWLFIVAPLAGGIAAAIVWRMSFSKG